MKTRIIVKLDVKPPFVVKPIYFEGLRKVGLAEDLVKKYYAQGADEIFYTDIVSSLYQRDMILDSVRNSAKNLFIPFCVGGAVRSIDDFSKLFHNGADKVSINTHAIQVNPNIIDIAASTFGSQSVVVNIESKKIGETWECLTDCGRIRSGKNAIDWARESEDRGAGEIFLQSVDSDGKMKGFDLELCKSIVDAVNIPVVVSSGAGSLNDIKRVVDYSKPSGVAIASLLHYDKSTIFKIRECLNSYE